MSITLPTGKCVTNQGAPNNAPIDHFRTCREIEYFFCAAKQLLPVASAKLVKPPFSDT